ncbi:MAG TPA: DUF1476 domain-containing protein [Rhodobacteraceae bacterium]|nr:DUF1476 domain-containing protein [Paracoccaceae bacterium]
MTTFDERESAFENKYAHDAEMQFKANARAHKMLGLWAAEKLGKTGDEAESYAKEVVISDLEEAGHDDVVRKLAADLGDKSSPEEIRRKMNEMLTEAKAQLMAED